MTAPSEAAPPWRMVHLQEYQEQLDFTGKNLIRMVGCSKDEVATLVGKMAAKSEMPIEELPGDYVTSLTGEVADEVHEWPNATLGREFRHLILQFCEERLILLVWKIQGWTSTHNEPWWKF